VRLKYTVSIEDLILMGCDEESAACWMVSRGKNKLTTIALKRVISEADKLGWTLGQAVKFSAEHGYIGFKSEWVKPEDLGMVKTIDVDFVTLHTDRNWAKGLN
jgi:hypothetical protein